VIENTFLLALNEKQNALRRLEHLENKKVDGFLLLTLTIKQKKDSFRMG